MQIFLFLQFWWIQIGQTQQSEGYRNFIVLMEFQYFQIRIVKIVRDEKSGLGLSIKGGAEHSLPIMISQIFKDQAADKTGKLFVGDAIIKGKLINILSRGRLRGLVPLYFQAIFSWFLFLNHVLVFSGVEMGAEYNFVPPIAKMEEIIHQVNRKAIWVISEIKLTRFLKIYNKISEVTISYF